MMPLTTSINTQTEKMNSLLCLVLMALCGAILMPETNGLTRRSASASNCAIGSACDKCPVGEYTELRAGNGRRIKVCCPHCGPYFRTGYLDSEHTKPFCDCDIVDSIQGDCWKGHQCDTCLAGPNAGYVGRINTIPICCANCERSGMAIASRFCDCLHNGP